MMHMQALRPDNVVVELCRSRSAIMQAPADDREVADQQSNPLGLRCGYAPVVIMCVPLHVSAGMQAFSEPSTDQLSGL